MTEEEYLIWLDSLGISKTKLAGLLRAFQTPFDVYGLLQNKNQKLTAFFTNAEIDKFAYLATDEYVRSLNNNLKNSGVFVISVFSQDLSQKEKEMFDLTEAKLLYGKGNRKLIDDFCIGVVGCRKPDIYGKKVTERFSKALAQAGAVVVSGLCYGVDTIAHETTLHVNGKTIAVLGGGFNRLYPAMNTNLADAIVKNGLLLSEYSPATDPKRYQFPERNRIIAALSSGVLITQAGEKSGALHTKNYAVSYGKDIFVVPSDIFREESLGNNQVLKSLQGAIVLHPDDILSQYNLGKIVQNAPARQLTLDEKLVIDALGSEELGLNDLVDKTKIPIKTLNSLLTTMRISGLIRQTAGNHFIKE